MGGEHSGAVKVDFGVVSLPINDYGRKLVRRNCRLEVTLTFRLVNGSGVQSTVRRSAVIRPMP